MKLNEKDLAQVPFWSLENYLMKRRGQLENACEDAKTLEEALKTGANSIYFQDDDGNADQVGYQEEDSSFTLYAPFNKGTIKTLPVEFVELGEDGDGYTIALFKKRK